MNTEMKASRSDAPMNNLTDAYMKNVKVMSGSKDITGTIIFEKTGIGGPFSDGMDTCRVYFLYNAKPVEKEYVDNDFDYVDHDSLPYREEGYQIISPELSGYVKRIKLDKTPKEKIPGELSVFYTANENPIQEVSKQLETKSASTTAVNRSTNNQDTEPKTTVTVSKTVTVTASPTAEANTAEEHTADGNSAAVFWWVAGVIVLLAVGAVTVVLLLRRKKMTS